MTGIEEVRAICSEYIEKAEQLERDRKIGEGLLGIGKKPADDPCHEKFADDIEKAIEDIASEEPGSQEARDILYFMYSIPSAHEEPKSIYWMLIAVHGVSVKLIPFLSAADAEELYKMYSKAFRRWERLPVQKKVCDLLKKQSGGLKGRSL